MTTRPLLTSLTRATAQAGVERALPQARAALAGLNEQLATGLRVNRASDDPAAYASSRALRLHEDRLGQYARSTGAAGRWADQTQTAVDALAELFTQAREVGLRAANGILDREDFARQLESLRDEAVSRLNARSGDEYLFGGNQTGTPPIQPDGTVAPGDLSGVRTREVGPGVTLGVNIPGTDALYSGGVLTTDRLQALIDAVRSGDQAAVTGALAGVEEAADHYTDLGGRMGTVSRRLQTASETNASEALVASERRSALEDADFADVLGQIQRRQTGLEAALRATASITQTSLLDYLR